MKGGRTLLSAGPQVVTGRGQVSREASVGNTGLTEAMQFFQLQGFLELCSAAVRGGSPGSGRGLPNLFNPKNTFQSRVASVQGDALRKKLVS